MNCKEMKSLNVTDGKLSSEIKKKDGNARYYIY